MILIITHKFDYTADYVVNKLNHKGIKYKRFNCEDVLIDNCSFKVDNTFSYSVLNESQYHSIWFRRTKLPSIDGTSESNKFYLLNEIDSYLKNVFSVLDAKWLSNPLYVYNAENKLLQLKVAKKIGFLIPNTLITNSKENLTTFYYENDGDIVIKPISQTRINSTNDAKFFFTSKVKASDINKLNEFDLTPCIFQKYIPKEIEIRVTVIGDKVYSAAVDSQSHKESSIDWRRKKIPFSNFNLPGEIKEKCLQLLKELNINFGAIDLIKTPNDEYYFLEINPNGQWVWIENDTGLPISDALIEFLTS